MLVAVEQVVLPMDRVELVVMVVAEQVAVLRLLRQLYELAM